MAKAKSFSIYLLKVGYSDPSEALKDDHDLEEVTGGSGEGEAWPTYLARDKLRAPWWKSYFSIQEQLSQGYAGAIVFIKQSGRTFALTFGQTRHSLRDEAFEYDFGLRTTLNAVEPLRIRNTDDLDPSTSRRRRTQLPERADLTYFDFDGDSSVLRSLTGEIRSDYQDLFTHATGASNLRISSSTPVSELAPLLGKIYAVYSDNTYLDAFPSANNIQPVQDPTTLSKLNDQLLKALREGEDTPLLTIPELVDFQDDFEVSYSGVGRSLLYPDASLADYVTYLASHEKQIEHVTLEDLRSHRMAMITSDGYSRGDYSLFRCLVFETYLGDEPDVFHLSEGMWYRVDADYLAQLATELDPLFVQKGLPERTTHLEYEYNKEQLVPHWKGAVLLDRTNTSPAGQSQVEPCDVARIENEKLVLTHVKLGVAASDLSHLFAQGTTAVELLNAVPDARKVLRDLLLEQDTDFDLSPLEAREFAVEYVIVTKKSAGLASGALPLFSRITLRRANRALVSMKADVSVHLAGDNFPGTPRKKPRKPRAKKAGQ